MDGRASALTGPRLMGCGAQVEVDDMEIRIHGRRDVLERLVMGGGAAPAPVPSFVLKWRTRQDSNL